MTLAAGVQDTGLSTGTSVKRVRRFCTFTQSAEVSTGPNPQKIFCNTESVSNPWSLLNAGPPFTLDADSPLLESLGSGRRDLIKTHLLPAPWIGPEQPRLIVLLLNPGYKPEDDLQQGPGTEFYEQQRLALNFAARTPFYQLDPAFASTGAYAWYFKRLRSLIETCGLTAVQQGVMFMQYFPYRSTQANFPVPRVPSLDFSLKLLRKSMQRSVPILVARSRKYWFDALPELAGYQRLSFLRNPRSPFLTPGNMGEKMYGEACAALSDTPSERPAQG